MNHDRQTRVDDSRDVREEEVAEEIELAAPDGSGVLSTRIVVRRAVSSGEPFVSMIASLKRSGVPIRLGMIAMLSHEWAAIERAIRLARRLLGGKKDSMHPRDPIAGARRVRAICLGEDADALGSIVDELRNAASEDEVEGIRARIVRIADALAADVEAREEAARKIEARADRLRAQVSYDAEVDAMVCGPSPRSRRFGGEFGDGR